MNVRLPERAMGDLRAQITAIKTGERRFLELLDRYGQQPVLDCIGVLMDQCREVAARERTRAIPDGVYEAEILHGRRRRSISASASRSGSR